MALSARFGPDSEEPTERELSEFNRIRLKIHEYRNWFLAEFDGITCADVQRHLFGRVFNLMDARELIEFGTAPGIREACAGVYTKSALKVADMLSRRSAL